MIRYEHDADGIVTLTIDQADRKQNVFDADLMQALADVVDRLLGSDGVRGAILTSGKRDFVAGADLRMLEGMAFGAGRDPAELQASSGTLGRILRRLETGGVPVVAAMQGMALGGGLELALACHRRVAADDPRARLGLPEVTLGLLPGAGGTQRLPRMIGVQPALPLLLEGKRLGVHEAKALGIVDEVVPADQLLATARAWLLGAPRKVQPWDERGFAPPGGGPDTPENNNVFMVAAAMLQARTQGLFPAPKAILSCVYEGCRLDLDEGLKVENRYFVELLLDPVAGNLIRTMFVSLGDANKLARRPAGVEKLPIRRLGVLGGGLMGSGIAYVAAKQGIEAVVLDVSEEKAAAAVAYADRIESKKAARGKGTDKDAILGRIHPTTDFGRLADCDVVIEAVFEDREIKADVTRRADAVLDDRAVFASNTSTLPITGLAAASSRPERFVGLHFFSPVEKMQLVEVIRARQTSDATLAHALDVVQALGKTPIVVNDARGFYTSRVFGTYVTEGLAMLREGVAPALIENAGRQTGMPMPPLALADDVGIDLMYKVAVQTRKDLGDATPENLGFPVVEAMVTRLDRAGRRHGRGFYEYAADGARGRLWAELSATFGRAGAEQPDAEALKERFLYVQAVDAARCMDEGVLLAAADADVGAVLGWGFAPWTGGPLSFVDTVGVAAFVARADALADRLGERFRPPALLRTMAAEGRSFYG